MEIHRGRGWLCALSAIGELALPSCADSRAPKRGMAHIGGVVERSDGCNEIEAALLFRWRMTTRDRQTINPLPIVLGQLGPVCD